MSITDRVHRRQRFRHTAANKLTLPLTLLREIRDGRTVRPRLLQQAIKDLESIQELLEHHER